MIELFKEYFTAIGSSLAPLFGVLTCHRAIYTGLAACHGSACLMTDKPGLYALMAALYSILAVRG
jgi:hypothetical protein